jgi:aminomethyltransferase
MTDTKSLPSLEGTPITPRHAMLNRSNTWSDWMNGLTIFVRPADFGNHEAAVSAMRNRAILEDKSPLSKYFFTGPDAAAFLQKLIIRDISTWEVGQSKYIVFCNEEGRVIIDGVLFRFGEDRYCYTSGPMDNWFEKHRKGFDVEIEDASADWGNLHVQGPAAFDIIANATGQDWGDLKFGRSAQTQIAGVNVWLWRVGFGGERGFEVWVPAEGALPVFDALVEAGTPYGMEHFGDLSEDVCRIEAGLVLPVIDYTLAGPDTPQQDVDPTGPQSVQWLATPSEIGAGRFVDFDKGDFIGRDALMAERDGAGPRRQLVGIEVNWRDIVALQEKLDRPPRVPVRVQRFPLLELRQDGSPVGHSGSIAWSHNVNGLIGLARVSPQAAQPGTELMLAWREADQEVGEVRATTQALPFIRK